MKGQEQVFGICQHCQGALQFEAALAGQTTACPHCGQVTRLTPGKLRSKSNTILWVILLLICAVGIAAALTFFSKKSGSKTKPQTAGTSMEQAPAISTDAPDTKPTEPIEPELPLVNGFNVGKATLEKAPNSRLIYAVGIVRNPLNQQRFGVRIELNLLDGDGNQVGTATDYANVIEPKGEWRFRALVTETKAVLVEVAAVKENF